MLGASGGVDENGLYLLKTRIIAIRIFFNNSTDKIEAENVYFVRSSKCENLFFRRCIESIAVARDSGCSRF